MEATVKRKALSAFMALVLAATLVPAEALTNKAYAADPVITMGVQQSGIALSGEENFYRFSIPASGKVTISGLVEQYGDEYSFNDHLGITVYQADMEKVGNSSGPAIPRTGRAAINVTQYLTKGDYLLGVRTYSYNSAQYSFKLSFTASKESFAESQDVTNNTFATASPIVMNKTYLGQLGWNDGFDYYRFTVPSARRARLIANWLTPDYNNCIDVILYDANWVQMGSWDLGYRDVEAVVELSAGTYYICFQRQMQCMGDYSLQVADAIPISKAAITLDQSSFVYSGRPQYPSVVVTYGGKRLAGSGFRDYDAVYSSNTKAGIGKVTITGLGRYSGKVVKTFQIKPSAPSITSVKALKRGFKVRWDKKSKAEATGYQIQYGTSKSKMKKAKAKTVKSASKKVGKLKKGKTYYVRVRAYKQVGKQKIYSAWSACKKVKTKK